jgi:hypothetical protein
VMLVRPRQDLPARSQHRWWTSGHRSAARTG